MGPQKKFPDRWFDYEPIKEVIRDAKIVAFKVPMPNSNFKDNSIVQYKWTIYDLINYIPDLGLVIDLTFKFPAYYNPQQLLDHGVQYVKIGCAGHVIPPRKTLEYFFQTIDYFHIENPNKIVGVHCTHGVNRTGYMICRYLVEKRNYSPMQALESFQVTRGYPVERENYINDILKAKEKKIGCSSSSPVESLESFQVRGDYSVKQVNNIDDTFKASKIKKRKKRNRKGANSYLAGQNGNHELVNNFLTEQKRNHEGACSYLSGQKRNQEAYNYIVGQEINHKEAHCYFTGQKRNQEGTYNYLAGGKRSKKKRKQEEIANRQIKSQKVNNNYKRYDFSS